MSLVPRRGRARRIAHNQLEARQAEPPSPSPASLIPSNIASPTSTSASTIVPSQPTTVVPLTTTFTPPASCTENRLSQLPPPGYFIWANEPVPAANHTSSACYPREFLEAYQSVSSGGAGSSVVPALSPLICPANYCTMLAAANNYVACCPSGYQFHRPDSTIDPKRPGYGGTCYSDFTLSSTYTVTAYNISGATNLAPWVASVSGLQAYAHPIDGFAASSPSIGCPTLKKSPSSSPFPSSALPSSTPTPPPRHVASRGTIAGVSVAAVSGLAILVSLIYVILRCLRNRRELSARPKIYHIEHDSLKAKAPNQPVFEKEGGMFLAEMATSEKFAREAPRKSQLNEGMGPFEMGGDSVPELDAGHEAGKKGGTADKEWKV